MWFKKNIKNGQFQNFFKKKKYFFFSLHLSYNFLSLLNILSIRFYIFSLIFIFFFSFRLFFHFNNLQTPWPLLLPAFSLWAIIMQILQLFDIFRFVWYGFQTVFVQIIDFFQKRRIGKILKNDGLKIWKNRMFFVLSRWLLLEFKEYSGFL